MSPLAFSPRVLPDEVTSRYARRGYRSSVTLGSLMRRNQQEFAGRTAVIEGDVSLTWRELIDEASRFAGFLNAHGIGAGDVVTWQLPNWWESLVVAYGVWAAGAISSPVVPIYREHELRQIVEAVRPRCVVVPESFRGVDHVALLTDALDSAGFVPDLRVVLRGAATGWVSFEEASSARPYIADEVDVNAPALIGFTSGTTSGAKAVVHSAETFVSSPLRSSRHFCYSWRDRSYMAAPIAHAGGLLSAVAVPVYTGSSVVLRDRWDPEQAIDDILSQGVTFSSGASVFMRELLSALTTRGLERLDLPRGYSCGGSTIPTELARAADAAGMRPGRSWGMTECPNVTASAPFESAEVRCATDGRIAPGCEVRVVDQDGQECFASGAGEFLIRGPQLALGYLNAEQTRDSFDDEGWFRTGDLGFVTSDGLLTVTGRSKEIINRGGEKISGREIEDLLTQFPGVVEAAVVPAPHPRLGEQPAAFLMTEGVALTKGELTAFLRQSGLAPQKIPTVWRFVDDLPRTASGKVKKYLLQDAVAQEGEARP
jgi:acyl-CoA synthetase (AMP-forming)/AMP-acid ligase II